MRFKYVVLLPLLIAACGNSPAAQVADAATVPTTLPDGPGAAAPASSDPPADEHALAMAKKIYEIFAIINGESLYPVDDEKCMDQMLVGLQADMPHNRDEEAVVRSFGESEATLPKAKDCLEWHSRYQTPKEAAEFDIVQSGHLSGVGLQIELAEDDAITITKVIPNSPSSKLDIAPGDVVKVVRPYGGTSTPVTKVEQAVDLLRGPAGTRVEVTLERRGTPYTVTITRAEYKIDTVEVDKTLPDGIGYIKVTNFGAQTSSDFKKALATFRKPDGSGSVIVDLRDDPGGLLGAVLRMLENFAPSTDSKLLTVSPRDPNHAVVYLPDDVPSTGEFKDMNIVILLNSGSASASEIMTGTLQDWGHEHAALLQDAALSPEKREQLRTHGNITVVGEQSFGKGLVQTVFRLRHGGRLILTTAEYKVGDSQTPIQGHGVTPDVPMVDPLTAVRTSLQGKRVKDLTKDDLARLREAGKALPHASDPWILKGVELLRAEQPQS